MGSKTILLILAFLIIFGSIIIFLSEKQAKAIDDLGEATYEKQVKELVNSFANDGMKELKDRLNAGNFIMPNISNMRDVHNMKDSRIDRTVYNSSIPYVDTAGITRALIPNQYYIVTTAHYTAPNDITYRGENHIMYIHDDPGNYHFPNPVRPIPDARNSVGRYPVIPLENYVGLDSHNLIFWANGFTYFLHDIDVSADPLPTDAFAVNNWLYDYSPYQQFPYEHYITGDVFDSYSNVLYIPQTNYGPLRIGNGVFTSTSGVANMMSNYHGLIFVEGDIRIDGPLMANQDITIICTGNITTNGSQPPTSGTWTRDLINIKLVAGGAINISSFYNVTRPYEAGLTEAGARERLASLAPITPGVGYMHSWREMPILQVPAIP